MLQLIIAILLGLADPSTADNPINNNTANTSTTDGSGGENGQLPPPKITDSGTED